MDHVSGTERFMELSSRRCKSPCPPRYKAPVQAGVGERRRSLPPDPQLSAVSRPSQVGGRTRRWTDGGVGTLVGVRRGCRRFSFPPSSSERPEGSAFLFPFPSASSTTRNPHPPGEELLGS